MAKAKKDKPAEAERLPLRLEYRSPDELTANLKNWRTHPDAQVRALGDVLAEVGWAGACLYNERTNRLIDGHARRKLAIERGEQSVPVLVGSWSEADEAKILATLDPLAAMAETDAAKLDALLRDVQTGSGPIGNLLTELHEQADAVTLKEANSIGGDTTGVAPDAVRREREVRAVLMMPDVEDFEAALAATGEMNRAKAMMIVCRSYLEQKRQ